MALRDYQKKRVFDAQAEAATRITASRRLALATRVVNSRWWKDHQQRSWNVMLAGTGCQASYVNTRTGLVTIVVPELAVTDIEVFHALVHLVPNTTSTAYMREPPHGPMFCRHLLSLTAWAAPKNGQRLAVAMDRHKVNLESTLLTTKADVVAVEDYITGSWFTDFTDVHGAAARQADARRRQRDETIASLQDKLRRLREKETDG